MKYKNITQGYLHELFIYNDCTGDLVWKEIKNQPVAGCIKKIRSRLYVRIGIDGDTFLAHRLIWIYLYAENPVCQIDHINGDGTDNRIKNLRKVSNAENCRNRRMSVNNTSGVMGVVLDKRNKRNEKWRAQIVADYQTIYLGTFNIKWDAICARKSAEFIYGFHNNHGTPIESITKWNPNKEVVNG